MSETEKLQKLTMAALRVLSTHGLARNCHEKTKWAGTPQQQKMLGELHETLCAVLPQLPEENQG